MTPAHPSGSQEELHVQAIMVHEAPHVLFVPLFNNVFNVKTQKIYVYHNWLLFEHMT
jgi:hypothetical protein